MTTTVRERVAPLLGKMTDADVCDYLAREGMLVDIALISRWRRSAGIPAHGRQLTGIEPADVERAVAMYHRCEGVLTVTAARLHWDKKRVLRALRQAGLR